MPRCFVSVALLFASGLTAIADEPKRTWATVPNDLRGQWFISRCEHNHKPIEIALFADGITVGEEHFWPSAISRANAEDEHRIFDVRLSPTDDKRLVVFWFCGVYRKSGEGLQLLLSYHGQGLEGDEAKNWRWPTIADFDAPTPHTLFTLTRKPPLKKDAKPSRGE